MLILQVNIKSKKRKKNNSNRNCFNRKVTDYFYFLIILNLLLFRNTPYLSNIKYIVTYFHSYSVQNHDNYIQYSNCTSVCNM